MTLLIVGTLCFTFGMIVGSWVVEYKYKIIKDVNDDINKSFDRN